MQNKNRKSFIFCVHAHQPVGNFGYVFKEAFDKCYLPFVEVAEKFPNMPLAFHFSGSLIDWIEKEHPEFIKRLARLAESREIEFLGGAYYEPIYGAIPSKDLAAQIGMMRDKIKTLFGQTPEGVWLTERVWDPEILETLLSAGVQYTVLDDANFEKAGQRSPVTGYFSTEDRKGRSLDLFASSKALRYLIPFREPKDAVSFIHNTSSKPDRVVVFADDCEKFGLWPGTHSWVYEKKWLERFFSLLEKDPMLDLTTFRSYRHRHVTRGKVTVPHSSYGEMMEWSGGHFTNFFEKYSESGYMKGRMQRLSHVLSNGAASRVSPAVLEASKQALYRAQCNCSYWHGVFGGLYLHHLRSAVYENIIQADAMVDCACPAIEKISLAASFYWKLRQEKIASFFNPECGGALEELDYLPKAANVTCTLQRRPEPYHCFVIPGSRTSLKKTAFAIHRILGAKDKNIGKKIFYDRFRRLSFMDHFFAKEIGWQEFRQSSYKECGDFVNGAFQSRQEGLALCLSRRGMLKLGRKSCPIHVEKKVESSGPSQLRVRYTLANLSTEPVHVVYGTEFNFSIGESSAPGESIQRNNWEFLFHDSWRNLDLKLTSSDPCTMLAAPIETVSESEGGMEGNYQQMSVLLQRNVHLEAGQCQEHVLTLEVLDSR